MDYPTTKNAIQRSYKGETDAFVTKFDTTGSRILYSTYLGGSRYDSCGYDGGDITIVFTSDNGPWAVFDEQGGSAGLLRGAKGGTYEGGMREPAIFWHPGAIKPGVVIDIGSTLDLLPTFCTLAGIQTPSDRVLDGYDLSAVLSGKGRSPRQTMFYWRGSKLYAVRRGSFKAHFITQPEYGGGPAVTHATPELYNLDHDPSEKWNIAVRHPEVITEIRRIAEEHKQAIPPVENQLDKRITTYNRK
jgi:arylsulfatase A